MKTTLSFILLLFTAIFIAGCSTPEAPIEKSYVIGFVNPNPLEKEGAHGFLRNMPEYGYIEGKNLTYIKCETKNKAVIESSLKEMVAKKVDLIFTMTTPATRMAKKITKGTGIPVVFVMYDAIHSGIVEHLVNHGGNLTGVQLRGSSAKAVEKLLSIAPGTKHIFAPVSFDTGAANLSLADLQQGAAKLGTKVTVSEDIKSVEQLRTSLADMPEDVDALFIIHTWLVGSNLDTVIEAAIKRQIPVFSAGHVHFDDGLVFSYGPRDNETGMQVVRLAHNILHKGTPPSELPVETSDFFLGINMKTAKAVGIEMPYDFLSQAEFIIR